MVVSIKYTDGDARSYKAVELHTRTDHHTFDSGDFPTDWFGMLKFVTSLPDDTDEYDGLMFSSSVFHFFYFDGGWWKYRREEWENGDFTWIRMFGGEVDARKEDVVILESWYQRTINP
jgi:hypothetical protein